MTESSITDNRDLAAQYDASYYEKHCGPVPYKRSEPQWANVFGGIVDHVIRSIRPRRVLDVGCALGFLVEACWDRGVEAWGIDVSQFAIDNVRPDMRGYCKVASAADSLEGGPFDLVACIEVLEHLPERDALSAIRNMSQVTDAILFSSSPYDFEEPTHINVRPTLYWLRAFQDQGFAPDILFDASFVAPHSMLLRKTETPHHDEILCFFAQQLHLRHEITNRMNQINELNRDLGIARTDLAGSSDTVEKLRWEVGDRTNHSNELNRDLSATRADLVRSSEMIEKLRVECASLRDLVQQNSSTARQRESEIAVLQEELRNTSATSNRAQLDLANVKAELKIANAALEQAEQMQDRIREELDVAAANVTEYLRNNASDAANEDAATQLLGSRVRAIESEVAAVGNTVNSIATSRIWRSLVRGAGLIQWFLPDRNR